MLSRNLEQTLHRALSLASERRHEYATLEHLLLALVDDEHVAGVDVAVEQPVDDARLEPCLDHPSEDERAVRAASADGGG